MSGIELIAAERKRQIEEKGYDAKHDDAHADGELVDFAAIVLNDIRFGRSDGDRGFSFQDADRWAKHVYDKYETDIVRRLTIAAAVCAAEIDRLSRKQSKPKRKVKS